MRGPIKHFKLHLGTFGAGIAAAAAVLFGLLAYGGYLFTGDSFQMRALLPTSSSLTPGSSVTMAGVDVGNVTGVRRQGYATLVTLDITDKRVLPVPADSRVTLRQRTPVGENYISIARGTSKQVLTDDAVLPVRQSDEYVDVDQILSVLQGPTEKRMRELIQNSGGALDGRGEELNHVLGDASDIVRAGGHLFGVLADDRRQTAELVDQFGRVSAAIGERDQAIKVTAQRGLVALGALASRDAALARTLDVLPSTLAQVRRTSDTLRVTSQVASPVVANLADTVGDLKPALADLRPAAATGRRVVRELGRAAPPLRTTLQQVTLLGKPLSAALPQMHKTLCQINPVVRYAAPYTKDVLMTIMGLGSASNSYDALGHLIRLTPVFSENSMAGDFPDDVSQALFTLTRAGLLGDGAGLTWNPYPKPGRIGADGAPSTGGVIGPDALAKTGYKYPHILADC